MRIDFRGGLSASFLVLALFYYAPPAHSQSVTATLVGTVLDQAGAAVPGALVTLTHRDTNVARMVETNERGDYIITNLQPGAYRLTAEHPGFKRTIVIEVELLVNQTARVDLGLQIGELAERVEVTGAAPLVASETSSVGQVIQQGQILNLPLKGRALFELAQLAPGTVPRWPGSYVASVRPMPGVLAVPTFSAAGGRDNNNGYLVDGVDAIDPHYLTPSMFPSVEAIQEFKLQSNAYSAEFGRFSVQINATTRSGTNELHGSMYEFFRNQVLDAANFFDNFAGLEKAPLRYNLFGGTLGGPISLPRLYSGRDRTFLFVSYEGTRIRRGSTAQLSVPTQEQRNGDFSHLGFRGNRPIFDPATTRRNPAGSGVIRDPFPGNVVPVTRHSTFAKTVMGLYPLPTQEVATGSNFFSSISDLSDNNQIITRMDHRIGNKTSLSFRYSFFDGLDTERSPIENGGESTVVRTQNAALSAIHTFSPNTLYELRLGYNRPTYFILQDGAYGRNFSEVLGLRNLLPDPIAFGIPNVGPSGFSGMGLAGDPNAQKSNIYQLINYVTLIRGAHSLKTGAEVRKTNYNDRGERSVRGSFSFTGAMTADPQQRPTTGVSIADLLLGLPLTATGSGTTLAGNFNNFSYAFFVQDDWKMSRRLTVNLGLRYELNTRYTEVQNRISYFDRSFPGGRLLLAGGSQAYLPDNRIVDGPYSPRGLFPADKNNVGPRIGLAFRPFADNRTAIRMGYGIFYTMVDGQATRQLERNPPVAAVVDLRTEQDGNSLDPGVLRVSELFPAAGSQASRPQVFSDDTNNPEPYIQQWNLNVQHTLPGTTLLEVGYMGSKGTRMVLYVGSNQAVLDADPFRPTPILNRRPFPLWGNTIRINLPGGNSTYHGSFVKLERRFAQGLSFLASYTFAKALDGSSEINEQTRDLYNRTLDKGRTKFDIRHRAVASGTWDLPVGPGKRYLAGAGWAGRILGDWQLNMIMDLRSGFPFSVGVSGDICNCAASGQLAEQVGDPRSGFQQSREQWFNTAAFAEPIRGRLGSSGRNILDGPGGATVDLSVFKNVPLREGLRLQLRGEFFNLFNRVNFAFPGSTVGTPGYGVIQSAGDARMVQIGLKLAF